MTEAISIGKATGDDSHDIWIWRNDVGTRAMSLTTEEVSWDAHSSWFERSLVNKNRFLYVGRTAEEEKVGMCRFDIDDDQRTAEVSINLSPIMRGKKQSYRLLAAAIRTFWLTKQISLTATIKKQNTASISCFTKCGFIFDREENDYNFYTLVFGNWKCELPAEFAF